MALTALVRKGELLEGSGYVYHFERELYYNPETRKIFSVEYVEDHSADDLQCAIDEGNEGGNWRFYFNTPPSDAVKRELEGVLG